MRYGRLRVRGIIVKLELAIASLKMASICSGFMTVNQAHIMAFVIGIHINVLAGR